MHQSLTKPPDGIYNVFYVDLNDYPSYVFWIKQKDGLECGLPIPTNTMSMFGEIISDQKIKVKLSAKQAPKDIIALPLRGSVYREKKEIEFIGINCERISK